MNLLVKSASCVIAIAGLSASAFAEDVRAASEKVVACQDVADPMERLACFETAATELSAILALPVQEAMAAPTPAMPTQPMEQAAAPDPTAATPVATAATAAEPQAPVQQAAAATTTEADVPQSRLPSWIPRITFGGDRDVEKEPDEFATKMTRIQVNRIGRHFFTTAEGHVWRQKTPDEIRAPKTLPADVVIYQNITGGLRLKIVETNRSYAVQRVE